MKRKDFLKVTTATSAGLLFLPGFLRAGIPAPGLGDGIFVVLQLSGGNDGLNTWIPYTDPLYYELRPNIHIPKSEVIRVNDHMGWHPSLKGFSDIQQKGALHVIQNIGYPQPDRSHFRSMEIWQTARPDTFVNEGWLGHYMEHHARQMAPSGITLDAAENLSLRGDEGLALTIQKPDSFEKQVRGLRETDAELASPYPQLDFIRGLETGAVKGAENIKTALDKSNALASYPNSKTAANLKWIARLIKGGLPTKVYYTSLGGFDTHVLQKPAHAGKLKEVSEAVHAFYQDLTQSGHMKNVTLMVFSEFGRRVKDNGTGTDHGAAAPLFLIHGGNHGKVLGKNPDLANLDKGDLKWEIDFRSIYAWVLKNVLFADPLSCGITHLPLPGL